MKTTTDRSREGSASCDRCGASEEPDKMGSPFWAANKKQPARRTNCTVILYTLLIVLPKDVLCGSIATPSSQAAAANGSQPRSVNAVAPTIDYSHNMRILKLPKSTQVGSLIYRLRGSDADPDTQLVFGVAGIEGRQLVDVVPVAGSWNEADVYLRLPLLDAASSFNLSVFVTDGNKTTQVESTILVTDDDVTADDDEQRPTNASRPISAELPFVRPRHVFHAPEDTRPDEPIGSLTVLESDKSDLPVRFELRGKGADRFAIRYVFGPERGQSRGELVLAQPLDYEKQNLFALKVLALNAWTDRRLDTRNVATLDIVVVVGDVQDSPPVFRTNALQPLRLANTLQAGHLVLRVEAEDGDYADQRPVQYALDASSPLASYFHIDKTTGDISLARPTSELAMHASWDSAAWTQLTVFAQEQPDQSSYEHLWPPMYAKLDLPVQLVDLVNEPPQFVGGWQADGTLHGFLVEPPGGGQQQNPQLVHWYTNFSETGSALLDNLAKSIGGRPLVLDLGLGANGTFELTLEGADARLFQLEPAFPVSKQTSFTLAVNSNELSNRSAFDADSEPKQRRSFHLELAARDFGGQTARIRLAIELLDANDNAPQFETDLYTFSVFESAPQGHSLGSVHARDPDSGSSGRLRYTSLSGVDSHLFRLHPDSGQVTLEGQLDREKKDLYLFLVETRDASGLGTANYTQLMVHVLDVNDNGPVFLQPHYDAVLAPDGSFPQPLVVRAVDADEPGSANSQLAYEIVAGNLDEHFSIDAVSGAIYPTGGDPSAAKSAQTIPQLPSILSEAIRPVKPNREIEETTAATSPRGRPRLEQEPRSSKFQQVAPMEPEQLPALDLLLNLESSLQERSVSVPSTSKVPPVTTLIVRAHDFGIPLRSSTVRVNIYNQALQSRSLSVILNGTADQIEGRRAALERALGSLVGGRAAIESVDALSDSSSISVARVRLATPQQSLVDLTDMSALLQAIDYQPGLRHQPAITHYITADRLVPTSSNITSQQSQASTGIFGDIHTYAIDTSQLERRLLIYIIIVGVCILSLLVIWMVYSCSREDQLKNQPEDRQTLPARQPTDEQLMTSSKNKSTQVKTAASSIDSSPVGRQLAKTHRQQPAIQNLLMPQLAKPDHLSMYNGQVWFEPNQRAQPPGPGRRISSAPSGGSLDSALHWAVSSPWNQRGSATPRNASGQFFPNTLGYMENLAALHHSANPHLEPDKRLTKRYRRRRVAPADLHGALPAPNKPPRASARHSGHGGHTNAAFESDRAADGYSAHSGDSLEPGESLVLDSDQELLGFDSSGTPIIATHTRPAGVARPLIVDMGGPVRRPQAVSPGGSTVVRPRATRGANQQRAASLARAHQVETETENQPAMKAGDEKREEEPADEKVADTTPGDAAADLSAETRPTSGKSEESEELKVNQLDRRRAEFKRASSQGDLMHELSARLQDRRQQSLDTTTAKTKRPEGEEEKAASRSCSAETSTTTASSNSSQSTARLAQDMKNGELLERQSIFALTYSGLATDKLPS